MGRLARLVLRIVGAMVIALIALFIPMPFEMPAWLGQRYVAIVVFVVVCYIGKLLYDTLFYDHYWP